MANDTKERILEAVLEMFSQNGYTGTNIRELSASLGLVKSGVYKHFESKEAIWNALLDQMIAYYGEHFGSPEHLPPVPDSLDELTQLTMRMVNITVHDEKIIMTRKVLTLEQYSTCERRREMYIVKAETNKVEKIVDMSIRAFETDVNVGGVKGECPPGFDSVEWHQQMAREGHLYQAMIGKDLVGAAIVFPDETKKSVYVGRVFIDSVYHRKGYGIRLMECIEKSFPWAAEFILDTPCWNERTNAFYKRLGYRIIKVEDGFVFYQKRRSEPSIIPNIT